MRYLVAGLLILGCVEDVSAQHGDCSLSVASTLHAWQRDYSSGKGTFCHSVAMAYLEGVADSALSLDLVTPTATHGLEDIADLTVEFYREHPEYGGLWPASAILSVLRAHFPYEQPSSETP